MAASPITRYYSLQAGGALHHIGPVYRSHRLYQQGFGLGSFLGNVLTYLKPVAMQGLRALSDQGYISGKQILSDVIKDRPIEQIALNRGKEALMGLAERGINKGINKIKQKMGKQTGRGGINKRTKKRRSALVGRHRKKASKQVGGRKNKKKTKRRSKKRVLDIFA